MELGETPSRGSKMIENNNWRSRAQGRNKFWAKTKNANYGKCQKIHETSQIYFPTLDTTNLLMSLKGQ